MNEFLEQFIIESRELVDQATAALSTLEAAPQDAAAIDSLFRSLHTLKGGAGIVDFMAMERTLHATESALSQIRSGNGSVLARLQADCLACLDLIVRWLDDIERTGELPADANAQATSLLEHAPVAVEHDGGNLTLPPAARDVLAAQLALLDALTAATFAGGVVAAGTVAANVLGSFGQSAAAARIPQAVVQSLGVQTADALNQQISQALDDDAGVLVPITPAAPSHTDSTVRTLRIDAERIDALVRLVGELTVVKNAIAHTTSLAQLDTSAIASALKTQHGVLERITGELQRSVLGMRVLPLRAALGRFPPTLREMSVALGKPVKLLIQGDETEADKAIVEMLFEPLLHVIRNAMDHGIESPAARALAHKPAVATLAIRGSRQGDRVLIEVSDDGGGIDIARIREVAVARGVMSAEALATASDADIIDLIFTSGFSTAATVTKLSGRGVGMDAVRTAVGRMGGTVSIDSRTGVGTTVRFSLPFSVMMTHVMTVEAGGQTFGIPLDAVIETIQVPATALTGIGAAKAIAHRNRTLPVFELGNLLQVQSTPAIADEAVIVVTSFAGQWGGIRVDQPGERMEVMLKPMEGLLAGIPGITGTTILGDGRVLLVLDLAGIL